ncbi:hypothetical protein NM36_2093 [Neisseria meningitidis NM36]|nr:hypothetical protein NM36_2093 [Neisseria meningitidis NM36]
MCQLLIHSSVGYTIKQAAGKEVFLIGLKNGWD